jgi:hypothetical protein
MSTSPWEIREDDLSSSTTRALVRLPRNTVRELWVCRACAPADTAMDIRRVTGSCKCDSPQPIAFAGQIGSDEFAVNHD